MESVLLELREFEHYFLNWIRDYEIKKGEENNLATLGTNAVQDFKEDIHVFRHYQMITIQYLAYPFLKGFIQVMRQDREGVRVTDYYIKEMLEIASTQESLQEYIEGVRYLYRLFKLHANAANLLVTENCSSGVLKLELQNLQEEYEELELKSKSIIAVARWILNENILGRKEEAMDNLRQMSILDPSNFAWHYLLCSRRRFLRRQPGIWDTGSQKYPSEEEILGAINSLKCSQSNKFLGPVLKEKYRLMCSAAISQCLAEILRAKLFSNDSSPTEVGDLKFTTLDDIVSYLKEEASNTLIEVHAGFADFIRYGEILGLILPRPYREYIVAVACMRAACNLDPTNSKVNHKMGSIILEWKKDRRKAGRFLSIAVRSQPLNFPAWMEYLPILLAETDKKSLEEVEAEFERIHELDNEWKPTERSCFQSFEGIAQFLQGRVESAVKLWLKAYPLASQQFKMIPKLRLRYSWNEDHPLTLDAMLTAIKSYQSKKDPSKTDENLNELINFLNTETKSRPPNAKRHESSEPKWKTAAPSRSSLADMDMSWRRPSGDSPAGPSSQNASNAGFYNERGNGNRWRHSSWNQENKSERNWR